MAQMERALAEEVDLVVDADAHLFMDLDALRPYLDDGVAQVLDNSSHAFSDVFTHTIPTPHSGGPYADGLVDSPEKKLANMEEWGIDVAVVSSTRMLAINTINSPQVAVGLMRAYNAWIQDTFVDDHENIRPLMTIAGHEPELAAEEIDRCADDFVGISFPAPGLLPPLGHRTYDPIYKAAERHDLPIVQHSATGGFNATFPTQYNWTQTYAEAQTLSHPFHLMWNVTTSLFWGLPERFPGLDLVFQEAGIGWVHYLTGRLDDHYLTHGEQMPLLDRLPSRYIDDHYYFTTQPLEHTEDPKHTAWAIEMAGVDSALYSADLPHPSFDPPVELYKRMRGHFDSDEIDAVLGGTADRLFAP